MSRYPAQRIAIFASGSGSNAQQIIEHFGQNSIQVALLVCNKKEAFVLERAKHLKVETKVISNLEASNGEFLVQLMQRHSIDWIVLAGYLRKVPEDLTSAFESRILNIHPSLLPKYGGKGMYGIKVHEQVLKNNEVQSGITIHQVNAEYDRGSIVFQASLAVDSTWTPEELAQAIHKLEHQHYPRIIEEQIINQNKAV